MHKQKAGSAGEQPAGSKEPCADIASPPQHRSMQRSGGDSTCLWRASVFARDDAETAWGELCCVTQLSPGLMLTTTCDHTAVTGWCCEA